MAVDWGAIPRGVADGSLWAADVFAWAWCLLDAAGEGAWPADAEAAASEGLPWTEALRSSADGFVPPWLIAAAASAGGREPAHLVVARLLIAIDRACEGLRAGGAKARPRPISDALWAQIRRTGSMTRLHRSGIVLGKTSGRAIPDYRLQRLTQNLIHVGPVAGIPVRVKSLVNASLAGGSAGLPHGNLRLAFVPALHDARDVRFEGLDHPAEPGPDPESVGRYFTTVLNPARQAALRASFRDLVARLEGDRVSIAILPEVCATPETAEALRLALVANAREAKRRGRRRPALRLALVGTGDGDRNEVRVFAGDGRPLGGVGKVHPWTMTRQQQLDHGVYLGVGRPENELDGEDRCEQLRPPDTIQILEHEQQYRILVLVCQDLAHEAGHDELVRQVRANLVVAPVLDGSLGPLRWAFRDAAGLAARDGTVVVANSLALDAKRRAAGVTPLDARPGIGIIAPPSGPAGSVIPDVIAWDGEDVMARDIEAAWLLGGTNEPEADDA
jgi:hypothetical protein